MLSRRRIVTESKYIVLYEDPFYWIVEDKTLRDLPIIYRGETKTAVHIVTEFVELPNGDIRVVRTHYSKELDKKIAIQTYWSWVRAKEKEIAKIKAMKEILERYERK